MRLDRRIEKTINYAEKYGMRLNFDQLWVRLFGDGVVTKSELKKAIGYDTKQKLRLGKLGNGIFRKKINTAKEIAVKLSENKNILMIAVTGSVAAENPSKYSDIDMLVVTREGTMWWTRLITRIQLITSGSRLRYFGDNEKKDSLCFNLWMDEKGLKIPKEKRTERNAMDFIMMKILFQREGVAKKIVEENQWVRKIAANGFEMLSEKFGGKFNSKPTGRFLRLINEVCYFGQRLYMKNKITRELVTKHYAYFHPKG